MRLPAADYLEADRIEELASDLTQEGYRVEREAQVGDQLFDLVAQRDGELLVIEVKARSRLKESIDQLARLRAAAREAGATSFRLDVVNPPREKSVEIEGLGAELTTYFLEELPPEVDDLSYQTRVKRVKVKDIESVDVRSDGIRATGLAALDVELNFRGKTDRVDLSTEERLGFTFDVVLGPNLKLARVNDINIDLSDFSDEERQ
jgi:hypothetical protein